MRRKRPRFFMQRDGATLSMVLHIFLRVIAQTLQANSPGAAHANKAALHIGAETEPPQIAPARGPPLWDGCDVPMDDGVDVEPHWDDTAQPAPDFDIDQRINW